jgi:hypothetical protein
MRVLLVLVLLVPLSAQDGQLPYKCGWSMPGAIQKAQGRESLMRTRRDKTYYSADSTFAIHYDTTGVDAPPQESSRDDNTPDWVVETAAAFMHADSLLMLRGYPPPPNDGDGVYDVYITDYGGGLYGKTWFENSVGQGISSYIYIDNDFQEEDYFTNGIPALWTTAAHEYFHAVQLAYGYLNGADYFYELSSNWFEELANPEIDDWVNWFRLLVPNCNYGCDFGSRPELHLRDTDGYSAAIFGHYLTWIATDSIIETIWDNVPGLITSNGRIMDEIDRQLALLDVDLAEAWVDFVSRLFLNGTVHRSQFHPDQLYLPQPRVNTSDELTVDGESLLTFTNLELATSDITVLLVDELSDLRLSKQSSSSGGTFGARVFHDDIFEVGVNNWIGRRLNSSDRVILVVGGDLNELVISATRTEPGDDIYFTLDGVGPNPLAAGVTTLTLKYTVFDEYTALSHKIILYNLLGQQVLKYDFQASLLPGSATRIQPLPQLGRLPSGIYILAFTLDSRTTLQRKITLIK